MRPTPLLATTLLLLLAACGSPGDTLPPDTVVDASTSPEDVVRTYLGALQDGDDEAAAALVLNPSRDDPWISDPPRIDDVVISPAVPESTTGTAGEGHDEAVHVPITFDLRGADETMRDGEQNWGYVLVRDGEGPWSIASQGSI